MPVGCGARGVVAHGGEHNVGQSPFQAAQGFSFRLAGGPFAFVVGAAFGVAADLGERDRVKGPVELPVSAGVEPVPDGAAGGGRQRRGAVRGGERVPVRVAADVDDLRDEPGRDQRADAYRSVNVVSAAATSLVIWRFKSAVSASMAMTRSRRRRHKVARMLVSSPMSSSAARTRARVVRIGIWCW